ncbi:MAG: hypothetical protein IPJ69_06430 [Deltaproteobacteria bacterium]|nr:MAG: hypothetical protein IPJ69_06430 [Deltaproteobacteria bacterium]
MFETLTQIGRRVEGLADSVGRGVSSLAEQVRAAIPRPDINLFEQSNGSGTVEFSLGSHRWQFDVSQRATYVLGNARSVFRRITGEPEIVERQRSRTRPRVPASLERCFDPTQERNAPAIAAQLVHPDPVIRGSGESAFRELVRHHPQAAAQAVDQQRQTCVAQGSHDQVVRLDQSIQTATHAVMAQPTSSRSLIGTGRSCVLSFTASLQPSPLKTQVLALIRGTPPIQSTPSTTPTTLTLASFPTRVRDAAVGAYPGVFMASVPHERASDYGAFARTFIAPVIEAIDGALPSILGALPTTTYPAGTHLPVLENTPTPSRVTTAPLMTPIMTPNGIVYIPETETRTATIREHDGRDVPHFVPIAHSGVMTSSSPTNNNVVRPRVDSTLASAANDTDVSFTREAGPQFTNETRENDSRLGFVDRLGLTPRPRTSHSTNTHSFGSSAFATLFTETPANDGMPISPSLVRYPVPEGTPFMRPLTGAPLQTSGGSNPRVAMRSELHEGSGNGGGSSGGRDEGGEGEENQGQRDRRQQQEQQEAAA